MPSRLCNGLLTFTTLMNIIFQEEIDDFVLVYIDDNLMYFKTAKEQV